MSTSPTKRTIDIDIGNLGGDLLAGAPLLTYLRYNVTLSADEIESLHPGLSERNVEISWGDGQSKNLDLLLELAKRLVAGKSSRITFLPSSTFLREDVMPARLKHVKRRLKPLLPFN